jgi:DNA invertase Pin-like site-specific DNA recombinase
MLFPACDAGSVSGNFVAYYRVSTQKQGRSGLGLEAQCEAVRTYLDGGNWSLLGEHTEVESGKRDDRLQLAAAVGQCKLTGAKLVIAKLDRLSRDAHFLLGLQKAA